MGRHDTNAMLALALCAAMACSATRSVRPVGKGRAGAAISVGGPLFVNLGPPMPVPVPVVSARYGLTERTDVDVGVILPVVPTMGLDVGLSTLLGGPKGVRPAVMTGARLTVVGPLPRLQAPHVLLESSLTASWNLTQRLLGYVGADLLLDTVSLRLHPTTLAGLSYHAPLGGLTLSAEGRWLGIGTSSDNLSVRYASLAGQGALGVVFAIAYTFNVRGHDHAR